MPSQRGDQTLLPFLPLNQPLNIPGRILLRLFRKVAMRGFFSMDQPFRVYRKSICNRMFFKTGVTEVDEIKMRAGKEGTLQKVFLKTKIFREHLIDKHTWRHRYYQKLLLSLCFLRTFVLTIKISYRDELPRINFTLNKISMKNLISFICLYYLKN